MKDKDIDDTIERYWTGKAKELKFHGQHKGSVVKMANVDDATVEYMTPNGSVKIHASPSHVKSLSEVEAGGSWTGYIESYKPANSITLTASLCINLEYLIRHEGCTTQLAREISQQLAQDIQKQVLDCIKMAKQGKWEKVK